MAAIGGSYPFTFSLLTAPPGMTINASTGVIDWPDPTTQGSPHTVTARVVDQEGQQATVTWTITVTTAGFGFVDAIHGKTTEEGGTGSLDNPWKTIQDWYKIKYDSSYATWFIYYKTGNYTLAGVPQDDQGRVTWSTSTKPAVHMAYPGNSPVFDMSAAHIRIEHSADNVYFEGIEFTNITNKWRKCLQIDSSGNNVTLRNNTFHTLTESSGSNNQSCIMFFAAGTGSYWSIQNNTAYDIRHGYFVLGYDASKVLVEDNNLHDFSDPLGEGNSHPIGVKDSCHYWFIRHNILKNCHLDSLWCLYGNTHTGITNDIEFSFNLAIMPPDGSSALVLNPDRYLSGGPVHVYRNTLIGHVRLYKTTSTNGPWIFRRNVIVNNDIAPNHVQLIDNSYPSGVVFEDNLTGSPSDNIVDPNGNLTSQYSSYLGSCGYQAGMGGTGEVPGAPTLRILGSN